VACTAYFRIIFGGLPVPLGSCVLLVPTLLAVRRRPRARLLIVPLLFLSPVFAQDPTLQVRKDETIAKADTMFGQRYTPLAGKTMRLYDQQTETGPPDEVIYWHGSSYVIELIFAADGSVARIHLLPEALLHSDSWTDVPTAVELSPSEMKWLIGSAEVLRRLGDARPVNIAPKLCFYSGRNIYCTDQYELARVNHFHIERLDHNQSTESALKDIAIFYKQPVMGIAEDARVQGSERQLEVGGQWYQGEKPGVEIFDKAEIGSVVQLVTYGCSANMKVCIAMPEKSTSTALKQ
jgi:hypothetical protein